MASIELTVAYPGREGAHSAAACDRLFPAARLVPLPTFSEVIDAVAAGRVPYGVLPIESSLVGPVAETHDLLYESPLSIVAEAIIPVNHCLVGPGAVELADIREIHSHPVALDQCRRLLASLPNAIAVAAPTTGDAASIVAKMADPSVVAIASDRAARINGLTIIDGNVGRPSGGVHTVRLGCSLHATRSPRRAVAHRVLLHDRSPPGSALPCARAAVAPRHRSQPAGLTTDPVAPVQLPLRCRARRPSARPRHLGDAEGDARSDRAASRVRLVSRRPRGRRGSANGLSLDAVLVRCLIPMLFPVERHETPPTPPRARTARATAGTDASSPAPAAPRGG